MNYKLDNQTALPDAASGQQIMKDQFSRPLHDLRISVIDRCNFRCKYCMPEEKGDGQYTFLKEDDWLTFPEIERLTRLFVQLGVSKVRLTGGEPLLRPNLPNLIKALRNIPGITDLALTTNGSLLTEQAEALKNTGLNRITVSLDAIDPNIFRQINGRRGDLQKILDGITKCEEVNFESIKINVVVQKNINDHQILDLVRYFKNRKPILRFIEYMDVGNCNHWNAQSVVPTAQIVETINAHFPIRPIKSNYYGEVASRYKFLDGSGEVGLIPSITQPFCRSCTRARLSTDGKVYTCLFATGGTDLKSYIRENASDDQILNAIKSIWQSRDDRYSELRSQTPPQSHTLPKVEMFQIGG